MTLGSGRPAVASPTGGGAGGRPLSERGWRITLVVHHVVVAVLVAIAMVDAVLEESGAREAVLLAALAVLLLAYATVGGPALVRRDHRRAARYLLVLVVVIGVLAWILPELLFLLFLAFPQVWFMVAGLRSGVLWTLALGVAAALGPTVHWAQGTEPFDLQTLVGVAFSLAMGAWVFSVLEHSDQRAALIRELESTRAELAVLHHQQGMVAERERLAREVHDTLAQGYTSIVVLAQTAVAVLPGDPDAAAERLAVIEEVARENLAEARAMVAAFAPVALDSATLVEALQRLAERFGRETGIVTRVDTAALGSTGTALSRAEEIVLLRGAQEALANVRRHAAASAVVLRISRVGSGDGAQVSVHVEDDGVGFDPAASAGVGLAGLRDRAEEVGGAVDVRSAPGEGTRVTVRVPVR
ncbi:sensor histidine kinase [Blastococcus goldschmidtiae]|uniref:Oxygen sensor histidine kinase NreB n=1 Tax=Blastococcus goldschmidtiae TaxID=3075546 RepID=A0ABU2K9L1_9ACTN|nr:sensor histidine kinase [Blastococcus sp. DSM 46792]MDT0276863.1 sensor histidine kinase [Blastococcus sp. DSM 46792]